METAALFLFLSFTLKAVLPKQQLELIFCLLKKNILKNVLMYIVNIY